MRRRLKKWMWWVYWKIQIYHVIPHCSHLPAWKIAVLWSSWIYIWSCVIIWFSINVCRTAITDLGLCAKWLPRIFLWPTVLFGSLNYELNHADAALQVVYTLQCWPEWCSLVQTLLWCCMWSSTWQQIKRHFYFALWHWSKYMQAVPVSLHNFSRTQKNKQKYQSCLKRL